MTTPPRIDGPRVNERITVNSVRLVDEEGEQVGVVSTRDAMKRALDAGLDLVEVSPNAEPPVCKIMDYGRFRFETQKKKNEARKKQKIVELKELKVRPNIDTHDYDVKMRAANKFISAGDKVKVTMRFRGREITHQDIGLDVLKRIETDLDEIAKVELRPKMEGRQMIMILAPR
ncbi:translation initiation factor IF-3 [Kiloniella laminariae]|uniref:Translation initiation factor IF-3 n=1 Tax=Kiloniella laminariae TaxID=454162 RepID=A0ABT4LKE8_9PROT|nr:translation initiation factor IF-3 [Kiloniella laminariae]MCZ4281556.1 translation initiation factor IF-3 [Kiloniella laminariae]